MCKTFKEDAIAATDAFLSFFWPPIRSTPLLSPSSVAAAAFRISTTTTTMMMVLNSFPQGRVEEQEAASFNVARWQNLIPSLAPNSSTLAKVRNG